MLFYEQVGRVFGQFSTVIRSLDAGWTILEKNQKGGVQDMLFPGPLKNEYVEVPGVN